MDETKVDGRKVEGMDGSHEYEPGRTDEPHGAVDERQGTVAVASDGHRLGLVTRVYPASDDAPTFVRVDRGSREHGVVLVPADDAALRQRELHVGYEREQVDRAPRVDAGLALDAEDRAAVTAYYRDLRDHPKRGLSDESVPLPPRGQERVIPSEGPEDVPPGRSGVL